VLRHKHGRRLIGYKVEESIKIEEALDGVYSLRTKEQGMSTKEVIEAYKEK